MRVMRSISCVSRTVEKPDILAGTAGIAIHSRKLRSRPGSIACIDELYCHMTVRPKAKECPLDAEK